MDKLDCKDTKLDTLVNTGQTISSGECWLQDKIPPSILNSLLASKPESIRNIAAIWERIPLRQIMIISLSFGNVSDTEGTFS